MAIEKDYWDHACTDLMKRDKILRRLITQFRDTGIISRGDPFLTLVRSIIGQQISVAAAQAVWNRVEVLLKRVTPKNILVMDDIRLRECGLSYRKIEYVKDLSEHFLKQGLAKANWQALDDETVIRDLTAVRGIGQWTAEMFLIFNLKRPDILPLDDIGLLRAISLNYFAGEKVTRSQAREVAENWVPYRTVATWYLWRSIDPIPVDY
ncbi:MAG: DNA-3-methyladenine glycosylase 2 family protein [Betaproteobacteria bacterium]|jgi:DNA-3-methyladenine glycosylase II|nr:DNA-3-methyladenine glycosylase 2 family protein [Polynucleobacter sp.]NBY64251.1 DNA-3-methyladenine glycosylase 2 family protein [Betaproteobacteria bacterium]NQW57263.1 DNA-3-methyladenine glycosylase 2 family protein [Polynucleobacter sp.]